MASRAGFGPQALDWRLLLQKSSSHSKSGAAEAEFVIAHKAHQA